MVAFPRTLKCAGKEGVVLQQAFHGWESQPVQQLDHIGVVHRRRRGGLFPIPVDVVPGKLLADQCAGAAHTPPGAAHPLQEVGVQLPLLEVVQKLFSCGDAAGLHRMHLDFAARVQALHAVLHRLAHAPGARVDTAARRGMLPYSTTES